MTPFYLQLYNSDGSAQTNLVTMTAWPALTNVFVAYGTNIIAAPNIITLVPNGSGYSTNWAYPNQYRCTVSNLGYSFTINLPDTTNFISLASCFVSGPVYLGGANNYSYVTNLLGFAPATNTPQGIVSALSYTPVPSNATAIVAALTFTPVVSNNAGITAALGFNPATNSQQGYWFLVTNVLGQTNANLNVSTNLLVNHLGGLGTAPTVAINTNGAGYGATAGLDAYSSDAALTVTVTDTVPAASASMFTLTFGRPYATPPHVVWSGANVGGAYVTTNSYATNVTTNSFQFWDGPAAWPGTNTNAFTFIIVQ